MTLGLSDAISGLRRHCVNCNRHAAYSEATSPPSPLEAVLQSLPSQPDVELLDVVKILTLCADIERSCLQQKGLDAGSAAPSDIAIVHAGTRASTAAAAANFDSLRTAATIAVVGAVSAIEESLLSVALPLDAHSTYWRERMEAARGLSPLAAKALDYFDAGPIEWLRTGHTAAAAIVGTRTPAQDVPVLLPRDRIAELVQLQEQLLSLVGLCRWHLAVIGAASSADEAALAASTAVLAVARSLDVRIDFLAGEQRQPQPSAGIGSSDSDLQGYGAAEMAALASSCLLKLHALQSQVRQRMMVLAARPAYQRYWLRYAIAAGVAGYGVVYLSRHHASLRAWASSSWQSLLGFYRDHVAAPVSQMAGEVLGGQRTRVADEAGLQDARQSLQAMLLSYATKLQSSGTAKQLSPDLAGADLLALATRLDMRPVSERFVVEVERPILNLATGDLMQLMLIQIAYIKKELLSALAAMDSIMAENRFNLALMATMPGLLLAYGGGAVFRGLYATITAPVDTTDARMRLRLCLRDIHKALTVAAKQETASSLCRCSASSLWAAVDGSVESSGDGTAATTVCWRHVSIGRITLLVTRLAQLLRSHVRVMVSTAAGPVPAYAYLASGSPWPEWQRLCEDVHDLATAAAHVAPVAGGGEVQVDVRSAEAALHRLSTAYPVLASLTR